MYICWWRTDPTLRMVALGCEVQVPHIGGTCEKCGVHAPACHKWQAPITFAWSLNFCIRFGNGYKAKQILEGRGPSMDAQSRHCKFTYVAHPAPRGRVRGAMCSAFGAHELLTHDAILVGQKT
jgi:hypothetical protein